METHPCRNLSIQLQVINYFDKHSDIQLISLQLFNLTVDMYMYAAEILNGWTDLVVFLSVAQICPSKELKNMIYAVITINIEPPPWTSQV